MATSEYAGREMSVEQFADAREAVELWANRTYAMSDPELYADICHLCTLAQGMWYRTSKEEG